MNKFIYTGFVASARLVFLVVIRRYTLRPELPERPGGYVLALTHLGHLDPFCCSVVIRRPIWWMARREFFIPPFSWLLKKMGAFSVNRQGIPVSAIRRAIELAREGKVVGICPEGGRKTGAEAAFRGGAIRQGVCSIAIRSGTPVVPCVMLGSSALMRFIPWLPLKRTRLWIAYGEPLVPPAGRSTRATREALRRRICESYVRLYDELRGRYGLDDARVV